MPPSSHSSSGTDTKPATQISDHHQPWQLASLLTRRDFLGASAASILASYALLKFPQKAAAAFADKGMPRAGQQTFLDASDPAGIDLYIERQNIKIADGIGSAITVNGSVPGPVIRMKEGKDVLIRVHNRMDESTSIHWHGMLLPFTMDGVPKLSFSGIAPHTTFTYRFNVQQNGTYWYHSHTGLQEQLGLYGMLIIEPAEPDPVEYDVDFPITLSDWTFENPHTILRNLKTIDGYYNYQRPTVANIPAQAKLQNKSIAQVLATRLRWQRMRMDPTDLADVTAFTYTYLVNGHSPSQNYSLQAKPGQRIRLRLQNTAANTFFDVRIPGLPMTVVQADGQNIQPVKTDEIRIAVAEAYDVIVTLPNDHTAYTLLAETMDRSGHARATLTPKAGLTAEVPKRRPRPMLTMKDMGMAMSMDMEMDHAGSRQKNPPVSEPGLPDSIRHGPDIHGPESITMTQIATRQLNDPGTGLGNDGWRVLSYSQLRCLNTPQTRRVPTREFDLHLTGNMHKFIWGFDGKSYHESKKIRLAYGECVRINMINDTMMSHPIHLHGMFMDLHAGGTFETNPRKHTVNVQPAELLSVDVTADAPGLWAFHCHLLYHMEAGMFRTVAVVRSLEKGGSDES